MSTLEKKQIEKALKSFSFHSRYEIRRKIGQGSYGNVYKAFDTQTKTYVAIKHMGKIFDDLIDGKRAFREISLLQRLKQPNIVSLLEVYVENNDLEGFSDVCLVLEFANSDLKNYMRSGVHLEMKDICQITYQILVGLNYIHSAGVIHRDLKPANVLLFENGFTKICDFGLSRFVDPTIEHGLEEEPEEEEDEENMEVEGTAETKSHDGDLSKKEPEETEIYRPRVRSDKRIYRKLTSHVVTRWYRAPELILIEKNYDSKIDVWSLGCILAELLHCLKRPELELVRRQPFFPGKSCFPLSPDKEAPVLESGFPVGNKDQLLMIIDKLGTPSAKELEFVSDKGALNYLLSIPVKPKVALAEYFPWVEAPVLELLSGCLAFNPHNRWSIQQCLKHPFFGEIRNLEYENHCLKATGINTGMEEEVKTAGDLRKLFVQNIKIKLP